MKITCKSSYDKLVMFVTGQHKNLPICLNEFDQTIQDQEVTKHDCFTYIKLSVVYRLRLGLKSTESLIYRPIWKQPCDNLYLSRNCKNILCKMLSVLLTKNGN